jgi:DNA adenine methylase
MRYPGGKGKTYHQIINLLPPHKTYIETHLGGGAVLRNKKPADQSVAVDRDPKVIEHWRRCFPSLASYMQTDALEFLTTTHFTGDEVIYCDPPYLPCTRRRRRVYRYDYDTHDHEALLKIIRCLPCRIVISGYPSELYDSMESEPRKYGSTLNVRNTFMIHDISAITFENGRRTVAA